jgi:signal peptidase I
MEQSMLARRVHELLVRFLKFTASCAGFALVFIVAEAAIAEQFYIPSGSMEPTLLIGDRLLATKYPYGYSTASVPSFIPLPESERILPAMPERGDVVVFRWPGDRSQTWVKRVIGLPGDRVALRNGQVWINGEAASLRPDAVSAEAPDNSATPVRRFIETLPSQRSHLVFRTRDNDPLDDFPEVIVPAGHVFVLGDNRNNSADSRIPVTAGGVGMLPVENLAGRVEAVLASWDRSVTSQPIWNWASGLRLSRFFTVVR